MRSSGTAYKLAWLLVAAPLIAALLVSVAAAARPNIVFLLSDDQRVDTIAALSNAPIRTPNLDRLVRRGTAFTRAHAPYPLCVVSRAEILTGAGSLRNGIFPGQSMKLNRKLVTLPQTLSRAGYHTWYVGKWHTQGRPSTIGYEESLGLFAGGGGRFWTERVDFKGFPVTGYSGWGFQTDAGRKFPERGFGLTADISRTFADAAREFIERQPDKPFFLHVNFTAPHDPLIMPTGYEAEYDWQDIPLPENFMPRHPFDHGNLYGRDERMLTWPRKPRAVRENLAAYYSVIAHLDEQVGRIVQALESTDQLDNTVIIFASDHGLAVGSHGLMGKQNMYEHTVLVPLIVAGPAVPANQRNEALAYLRDLYPTICELAKADTPETVDAESLLPLLAGSKQSVREVVFGYYHDSQRMVASRRWKLIHYPKIERFQLFDRKNDPNELRDLSESADHREIFRQLANRLKTGEFSHQK
jgi:arylsulfatase A-like enzyme